MSVEVHEVEGWHSDSIGTAVNGRLSLDPLWYEGSLLEEEIPALIAHLKPHGDEEMVRTDHGMFRASWLLRYLEEGNHSAGPTEGEMRQHLRDMGRL